MNNKKMFDDYIKVFLKQNSMLNLISKNDEKFVWEKHIFDSLAIENFFQKYGSEYKTLLDIGTGGGFPSVPIAIRYPNLEVYAIDSIRKKITAIENMKSELNISNLHPICDRVENLKDKFDIITSRAVAPLKVIASYAGPLLNKGGYFIAYKSKRTEDEILKAKSIIKKQKFDVVDIIEYRLPLEEIYIRNLIVLKKL